MKKENAHYEIIREIGDLVGDVAATRPDDLDKLDKTGLFIICEKVFMLCHKADSKTRSRMVEKINSEILLAGFQENVKELEVIIEELKETLSKNVISCNLLSYDEAALLTGLSKKYLQSQAYKGKLRVVRFSQRLVKIRRTELDRFISEYEKKEMVG